MSHSDFDANIKIGRTDLMSSADEYDAIAERHEGDAANLEGELAKKKGEPLDAMEVLFWASADERDRSREECIARHLDDAAWYRAKAEWMRESGIALA